MNGTQTLATLIVLGAIVVHGVPPARAAASSGGASAAASAPAAVPAAAPGAATTPATAADPFKFGTLTGWRSERLAFPLEFAPSLPYKGFEELRFAPGMFDPKSDTYFTYVFFWWVEGNIEPTREQLEKELVVYFRGLSDTVGPARTLPIATNPVSARVHQVMAFGRPQTDTSPRYRAVVQTPDPFNGGAMVTLNIEISSQYCDAAKHTCVFFCVSPQPYERDEWDTLWAIRNLFQCAEP